MSKQFIDNTVGAYLIEDGLSASPIYLGLNPGCPHIETMWTVNPFHAYHFQSKEVAQFYADFFIGRGLRVCYHEFDKVRHD